VANEGKKPTEFLGMRQSSQSRYNHLPCREYRTQGLPSCVLVILNSHSLGSYQLLQTIILRLSCFGSPASGIYRLIANEV
jgi:hypothetical protein